MRPAITHPELLDVAESLADDAILLRCYRPGDGEAVFAGIDEHRKELAQWLPWPDAHRCAADSEAYARRMQSDFVARRQFVFGIWDLAGGEYAGGAGLRLEGRSHLDQRDHHGRLRDTLHFALTIDDLPLRSAAEAD